MVSWAGLTGFVARLPDAAGSAEAAASRGAAIEEKTIMKTTAITRRGLLGADSASGLAASLRRPASAVAEFEFQAGR
jgi:hypothetical protein